MRWTTKLTASVNERHYWRLAFIWALPGQVREYIISATTQRTIDRAVTLYSWEYGIDKDEHTSTIIERLAFIINSNKDWIPKDAADKLDEVIVRGEAETRPVVLVLCGWDGLITSLPMWNNLFRKHKEFVNRGMKLRVLTEGIFHKIDLVEGRKLLNHKLDDDEALSQTSRGWAETLDALYITKGRWTGLARRLRELSPRRNTVPLDERPHTCDVDGCTVRRTWIEAIDLHFKEDNPHLRIAYQCPNCDSICPFPKYESADVSDGAYERNQKSLRDTERRRTLEAPEPVAEQAVIARLAAEQAAVNHNMNGQPIFNIPTAEQVGDHQHGIGVQEEKPARPTEKRSGCAMYDNIDWRKYLPTMPLYNNNSPPEELCRGKRVCRHEKCAHSPEVHSSTGLRRHHRRAHPALTWPEYLTADKNHKLKNGAHGRSALARKIRRREP
ncbi:hypothetical protein BJY01DRAFT_255458 [Aspergillus pseudoustus]|uniref:Uncharacterized protein n=1 Tax=Aspergillus pseudoustus TaxID=1810923 RepID=A0ABR4IK22_9EURO